MKLLIGNFEVEIKAKDTVVNNKKFNQQDTMYFLNYISTLAGHARDLLDSEGYYTLATSADEISTNIYDVLKKRRFL